MLLFDLLFYVTITFNILLGIIIYVQNPGKRNNQYYALFTTFLAFFIISAFLENRPDLVGVSSLETFLRLDFTFALLFFYAWFLFCVSFTKNVLSTPKYRPIIYAFSSLTLLLVLLSLFSPFIVTTVSFYDNVIHFKDGVLWLLYTLTILFFALSGPALLLFRRYKLTITGNDIERHQINIILFGYFLTIGIGVFVFLFLQTLFSISKEVSQVTLYGLTSLTFFTGYAIVKYQFLDIKIIIQRGIVFTALLVLIVGTYLVLVTFLGVIFQKTTNFTVLASAGITTIIGIFGVSYVERYFRKITNKFFFKDTYDYAEGLQELSEILNKNIDLKQIFKKTSKKLKEILGSSSIVFIVTDDNLVFQDGKKYRQKEKVFSKNLIQFFKKRDGVILFQNIYNLLEDAEFTLREKDVLKELQKVAKKYKAEIIVPIINGPLIILFLGKKLSGGIYTKEDVRLLKTFANQASVAIEKAELYGKVKKYSQELEDRVVLRTTQIERLQKEQERMIVDISHGLQTPLTIIKGELGLLEKELPHNKKLGVFERSLDKISQFIYDLLRLTKLETEANGLLKERFSMTELLDGLVEYLNILMKEKNIILETSIERGVMIDGDKKKIEELMINLVSNSVKYIPHESMKKKISITLATDKNLIRLEVWDNGIGISPDELEHIFDRFYRTEEAKKSYTRGTGLGLAISKKIVEIHGGKMHAESTLEKGTTFTVTLPLSEKK